MHNIFPQLTKHPAFLLIGNNTAQLSLALIQQFFCKSTNACKTCASCTALATKQHTSLLWLSPEKQYYTREQLEPIIETLAFSLAQDEHFFVVVERADCLNNASANSLLKLLEEPPNGYHFILCAEYEELIVPTIRSRCIMHHIETKNNNRNNHILFKCFSTIPLPEPAEFLKILEEHPINEQETLNILESLFNHWSSIYKTAFIEQDHTKSEKITPIIALLKKAMEKLPMPGSSTLFWRSLFLSFFKL